MEYGILVAVSGEYPWNQIVGSVASVEEASELIANYIEHGPTVDALAPAWFEIHRRDGQGFYSIREAITL